MLKKKLRKLYNEKIADLFLAESDFWSILRKSALKWSADVWPNSHKNLLLIAIDFVKTTFVKQNGTPHFLWETWENPSLVLNRLSLFMALGLIVRNATEIPFISPHSFPLLYSFLYDDTRTRHKFSNSRNKYCPEKYVNRPWLGR